MTNKTNDVEGKILNEEIIFEIRVVKKFVYLHLLTLTNNLPKKNFSGCDFYFRQVRG